MVDIASSTQQVTDGDIVPSTQIVVSKDLLPSSDQVVTAKESREKWGHKADFFLASIGLAVGLGNIWRFPYLCQRHGGGAFLVPYVIFMIILGLPLYFIEFAVGQRFRTSSVGAWSRVHPALRGVGWSSVYVSFLVCIYYSVVVAWCVFYFFMSFTSHLRWDAVKACENWPEYQKVLLNINKYRGLPGMKSTFDYWMTVKSNFSDCCVRDPPLWYFYQKVLRVSPDIQENGIGLNWSLFGCLLISWIITYLCLVKGILSSGKIVYFTAIFPYIVLIVFFFRGITLEGARNGIETFFRPEWSRLKEARIWLDAATQMFVTLSLGFGPMIAFASYMPVKNNCMRDSCTVLLVNLGTSLFAGIVVFAILGHREQETGIPVSQIGSGPGLAFITFSDVTLLMSGSSFWSVIFFFTLAVVGIDWVFGTLEALVAPFYDTGFIPKLPRPVFTGICAVAMFLIGLCLIAGNGFYLFQIFDDFSIHLPLLFIAFFQCVSVAWVYGADNFANDIEAMIGSRPGPVWLLCWKYVCPSIVAAVFIANCNDLRKNRARYTLYVGCKQDPHTATHAGYPTWLATVRYPAWAEALIAVLICGSFVPTLLCLVYHLFHNPKRWAAGFQKRLCSAIEYLPDPSWVDKTRRKPPHVCERKIFEEIWRREGGLVLNGSVDKVDKKQH